MDGARVVRIEIDKDEDGKIDRWEYYGRIRSSRRSGSRARRTARRTRGRTPVLTARLSAIDVSTRRDGTVNRVEHYENDLLVRAEEDTDEDGQIDKWETYDGERLRVGRVRHACTAANPIAGSIYGPNGRRGSKSTTTAPAISSPPATAALATRSPR